MSRALRYVRDHIPLEQGLRPPGEILLKEFLERQRPYSIRTRIKTILETVNDAMAGVSETIFH